MISSTSLGAFSGTPSTRPATGTQVTSAQPAAPARTAVASGTTSGSASDTAPDPTLRRGSLLDIQA